MSHYKHFTTKEREKILFFLAQEKTISFIAKELQRDKSSVSREIKRNTNTEGIYSPSYAQKQYEIRRRKCGRKPLLLNADIHKTVQFLFLQYQWSPEQISFRLKHEKNPIQISYATIYRGIYRGFLEEGNNPEWSIRVNVEHILGDEENLNRIPAKIRKAKNLQLLLETAVELARRKAVVEPGFVSAQGYMGRVQYLLPIYLTKMNKLDLAMTLTVMDGYYLGNTCLTLEMAYLNAL